MPQGYYIFRIRASPILLWRLFAEYISVSLPNHTHELNHQEAIYISLMTMQVLLMLLIVMTPMVSATQFHCFFDSLKRIQSKYKKLVCVYSCFVISFVFIVRFSNRSEAKEGRKCFI